MAAPAPWKDRKDYLDAERVAEDVANLLAPQVGRQPSVIVWGRGGLQVGRQ